MRKYSIKYRVGRVEWNGAWILPQYKIEDFLEDKCEVTVYSVEFGLTMRTLAQEKDRLHLNYSVFDQDHINERFIAKKTMRDNKNKKRINTTMNTEVNDDDFVNPPMGKLVDQEEAEVNQGNQADEDDRRKGKHKEEVETSSAEDNDQEEQEDLTIAPKSNQPNKKK